MEHTLTSEGFGVRLRPVRLDDAAFIVWLRNLAHARGRIGDSAADVISQEDWLREYFQRPDDYYFIIETRGGIAVGTLGFYDQIGSSAEFGRYVISPEVHAAIPSAVLVGDMAFGHLGLTELRSTVISTNRPVLSLNLKFGFRQIRVEPSARVINGKPVDIVHLVGRLSDWPDVRARVLPQARRAEAQVLAWERIRPRIPLAR